MNTFSITIYKTYVLLFSYSQYMKDNFERNSLDLLSFVSRIFLANMNPRILIVN